MSSRWFGDMPGSYTVLSGTSLAAPMVSAAAALMLQQQPGLSPATIKARLMKSASVDDRMVFETGAGYLDVAAALQATGETSSALSPTAVMQPDGTVTFEETADTWGGEWPQGLIWGNRNARRRATRAQTENHLITASGLVWGARGARFMSDMEDVESAGLIWGGRN